MVEDLKNTLFATMPEKEFLQYLQIVDCDEIQQEAETYTTGNTFYSKKDKRLYVSIFGDCQIKGKEGPIGFFYSFAPDGVRAVQSTDTEQYIPDIPKFFIWVPYPFQLREAVARKKKMSWQASYCSFLEWLKRQNENYSNESIATAVWCKEAIKEG